MATTDVVRAGILLISEALIKELAEIVKKKPRKRQFWTRPWILRRVMYGAPNLLLKEVAS